MLDNIGDVSHPWALFELLLEHFKRCLLGFRVHFDVAARKVAHIAGDAQSVRCFARKIAIPDALHTAANKVMFRAHNCSRYSLRRESKFRLLRSLQFAFVPAGRL
jgi:hypothetical protein